ncbi:hypothetical protein T439DRAFT_329791 [Meredithblackwellia eburnea MCA 4105]
MSEQRPNEKLNGPSSSQLPPPSSAFILPPPRSDLLDRIQAFLPQIKQANEKLAEEGTKPAGEEEVVVLEEVSDSDDSDEESSSEEEGEEGEDSSDDDSDEEEEGAPIEIQGQGHQGALEHLMDISSRKIVTPKRLQAQLGKGSAGITELEDKTDAMEE